MIWDYTTKLREIIASSSNWPLPYEKWPLTLNKKTNCLAFALGLTTSSCDFDSFVYDNPEFSTPSFSEVFERLLDELNLEWRKIGNPEEADSDEFVIQVYGFYKIQNPFSYSHFLDFHVIRRELDGTWVHKPDFRESPCEIDFSEFRKEYPDKEISGIFAVRKPR